MWIGVGLLCAGGLLAAVTIRPERVERGCRIGTLCVSPAGDPPLPAAKR
jgi:hypothetical protein